MVFSSLVFLWLFLPFTLIGSFLLRRLSLVNVFLLMMSLLFYAWGEPRYVLIMIFSILLNYTFGLLVQNSSRHKKLMVAMAIIFNLLILGYYKYINFAIDNLNQALKLGLEFEDIALPIGISFYTFQAISYIVDIFRGQVTAQKSPLKVGLYISFFPQLIAGPIVKYHDIEAQINQRRLTWEGFNSGAVRFIIGLAKKVLIANIVGALADKIMTAPVSELTFFSAWLGIIAYSLQIYYDFSGYSDMAIGLGRMFGFSFQENFNYPYISRSIREFWQRWHISLSTWFKQYLYIPLGGNREGDSKTYRNLLIVFLATGLWHGASWNFVFWGLWHGFFIIIERAFNLERKLRYNFIRHFYALLVVMIGWVFFRIETMGGALEYLRVMFDFSSASTDGLNLLLNYENSFAILAGIACSGIFSLWYKFDFRSPVLYWGRELGCNCALLLMFYFSVIYLAGNSYNPFIYFRF